MMKKIINTLFLLFLAAPVYAEVWPSPALVEPNAGEPSLEYGRFSIMGSALSLSNEFWKDQRMNLSMGIGLGHGFGFNASGATRDLSGYGAFQRGIGDTKLGLSFWPELKKSPLQFGVNGNLILPTGYRKQESYYLSGSDSANLLPPFSYKQTAGEVIGGMTLKIQEALVMSGFVGYNGVSDQTEQAFLWGVGTRLAPFGHKYALQMSYAESKTRRGEFPNTSLLNATLGWNFFRGFTLMPGVWADLYEEPLYGASIGLKIEGPLPQKVFPKKVSAEDMQADQAVREGEVLIPPPLSNIPLTNREELWRAIREQMKNGFDYATPLQSLDVPGLPFKANDPATFWNSMMAIHKAYPEAKWLLYSFVEHESITRANSQVPLLTAPAWSADCRLRVQLVDLQEQNAYPEETIEVQQLSKTEVNLALFSSDDKPVLSTEKSKALAAQAYRKAGEEIVRRLP